MYELNRFRLVSVGPPKARYENELLDFSAYPSDPDSLASVIWLQNGGGKGVLLKLLFSSLLPNRRDTLGAESVTKTLNNMVLARDTAHVIIEWRRVDGVSGVPPLLVTGRVMEWQGQRVSSDSSRLQSRFMTFHPAAGVLGLESLPVFEADDGAERKVRMAGYIERLAHLGREHPELALTIESGQRQWGEHLTNSGLDPELFRYQVQMNRSEGKADEVFKFSTDRAFVDFLLRAILDRDEAQELSDMVSEYADKLSRRDDYSLQAAFVRGALERLRPLASAHFHAQDAHEALLAAYTATVDGAQGMQLAAAATEQRASELKTRADEQLERRQLLDREYDRLVETRNELGLRVAGYELEAGAAALTEAATARDEARLIGRAWEAVEPVARLGELTARRDALARALDEATTEAEPLRVRRDQAAKRLAATLACISGLARRRAAGARSSAQSADEQARAATEAALTETAELSDVRRDISEIERLVREVAEQCDALAAEGLVSPEESPESAVARLEGSREQTATELSDAQAEAERVDSRLAEHTDRAAQLTGEIAELRPRLEAATAEHAGLLARAQKLAANETLQEILDSQSVDVWASEVALLEGLRERIARAERQVIETRLEAVEDERTVDAVDAEGLVPPHRDVTDTVQALQELGIAAHAGWRYLHENVTADRREAMLAACPQLASGVVIAVAEHLLRAQEAIRAARRDVRTLVTVGDARRLIDVAERADGSSEAFVAPNRGLYDEEHAAEQGERARGRIERAEVHRQAHELAASATRELRAQLTDFLDACPVGRLDELHLEATELGDRLRAATEEHERVNAEIGRLRDLRGQLAARGRQLRDTLSRIDRDLPRLSAWAQAAQRAQTRQTELAGLAGCAARLDEEIATHRREAADLAARAENLRREATADEDRADRLTAQVSELHGVAADVDPALAANDLDVARSEYEVADRAFREQTSDSQLAAELDKAEQAVSDTVGRIADYDEAVRGRAEELLAAHHGADRQLLRRARREAEAAKDSADAAYARAEAAHEAAQRALKAAQPASDRRQHIQLDEEWAPTGLHDARDKRARAARQAETKLAEANAMRTAAAESATAAADAAREAETLADAASGLRQTLQTTASAFELDEPPGAGIPHTGSAQSARERARDLADALSAAGGQARATAAERVRLTHEVMQFARDQRFATIREYRMVVRVADDAADQIARRAAEYVDQLRQRGEQINRILAEIDRHRDTLVRHLHGQVGRALHALKTAGRCSRLPDGLHEWSGRDFLQIGFRLPDSEDTLLDRLGVVLDEAAAGRSDREAIGLVLRGVHAAVRPAGSGEGGFRVTILKPDSVLENKRVPISEMSVFSGGQRLTAAIALYCTMATMRAVERGRSRTAKTGVLFLDNPLGTANAQYLLDIQLRVAAALGVQLVYTTGINDLNALSMFGRVLPLRNDADLRQGLRFVHLVPDMLDALRGGRDVADEQGYVSSAVLVAPRAAARDEDGDVAVAEVAAVGADGGVDG